MQKRPPITGEIPDGFVAKLSREHPGLRFHVTPEPQAIDINIDAQVYARIDKPRNGKWMNLLIRTNHPKRSYYPAYSMARGEFTNNNEFQRLNGRFPWMVELVKELITQSLMSQN